MPQPPMSTNRTTTRSPTVKTLLTLGVLLAVVASTVAVAVDEIYVPQTPQRDLEEFREHFIKQLPNVPLSEFVNGSYALDEHAYGQWRSTEEFAPYELDIERGKALFETPFANGRTYESCFKRSVEDIRAYYPYHSEDTNQVRTLLLDLNSCRSKNGEKLLDTSRGELLFIEAYLSSLARGQTIQVSVVGDDAIEWYTEGKRTFFMKRGRMNFSCADCHMYNAGDSLGGQVLSPAIGQTSHFPVYRARWQEMGSLHRRYTECMEQIGAQPFESQSAEFRALEYFHSFLSNDLKFNGPGFRK